MAADHARPQAKGKSPTWLAEKIVIQQTAVQQAVCILDMVSMCNE